MSACSAHHIIGQFNDHIDKWIKNFQFKVDELCRRKDLQFTVSIQKPDQKEIIKFNNAIEKQVGQRNIPLP